MADRAIPPHFSSPSRQDPLLFRLPSFWTGSSKVYNSTATGDFRSSTHLMQQQGTYLMPASPAGGRWANADYRPTVKKAVGHVPSCLVNASVTYCSNDRIYAFGGFDQFTDEGQICSIGYLPRTLVKMVLTHQWSSVQPRAPIGSQHAAMGTG